MFQLTYTEYCPIATHNSLVLFYVLKDAQNAVAAFALFRLFPDLPIHLTITDPYASFVLQWNEGEISHNFDVKN